jgi:tyrosyl-tRNA synthetase
MMGQRQQQVFLMPLLVGTDGVQKMSKSLGNYIAVDEPPYDMYGKVMSIPDNLIMLYYELLTDVPDPELDEMAKDLESNSVNPMDLKKRLAADIVKQFHSRDEARKAEERFAREVQKKEVPQNIPKFRPVKAIKATVDAKTVVVSGPVLLVEVGLASTGSAARQLIAQGSVDINGQTITGNDWEVTDGTVIRAGKRGWCEITLGSA